MVSSGGPAFLFQDSLGEWYEIKTHITFFSLNQIFFSFKLKYGANFTLSFMHTCHTNVYSNFQPCEFLLNQNKECLNAKTSKKWRSSLQIYIVYSRSFVPFINLGKIALRTRIGNWQEPNFWYFLSIFV